MDQYGRGERPIDVLFVGGYSHHHSRRARILERVADLASTRNVVFCLVRRASSAACRGPFRIFATTKKPIASLEGVATIARQPVSGHSFMI